MGRQGKQVEQDFWELILKIGGASHVRCRTRAGSYIYGEGRALLAERQDMSQWTNYFWFGGELVGMSRGSALYQSTTIASAARS